MTDPRIQARRVRVERQRGHRRLSILLGAIVAAGAAAGAVAIAHSSLFSARTVVIAGAVQTPRSEILGVTGLDREPPLIDVNTGAMQRRLERLPWVKSASVHLDWPSTVAIAVVERIPVAATALPAGEYALLDSTGRVLADQAIAAFGTSPRCRAGSPWLAGQLARSLGSTVARRRRPAPRVAPAPFAGDRRLRRRRCRLAPKGRLEGRRR